MFILEPRHYPNKPCVLEGGTQSCSWPTQRTSSPEWQNRDIAVTRDGVVTQFWHPHIYPASVASEPVPWPLPRSSAPSSLHNIIRYAVSCIHSIVHFKPSFSGDKPPLAPSCCSRQSRPPCQESSGQSQCRRGSRGHVSSACHTLSRDSGTMRRRRTLSRHNSLERARCNMVHSR